MLYLAALLLGVTAGLRAATPLAALAWAAHFGWIDLSATWAGFLGNIITVIVLTILALVEYFGDQRPTAPSRKTPPQFGARIVVGGIVGLVVGLPSGNWIVTLILGVIGAVAGTLGGFEARRWLANAFGRDLPAGVLEDIVAIVVALGAAWLA
jgi:uncharacterized membrane protein